MVAVPKEVIDLAAEPTTAKLLVTASAAGQPHAIVCGSIMITPDGKASVGEILMKRAKENLLANGKAALTIVGGPKSYELVLANGKRADSGEAFEALKAAMASKKLPCFAMWTFDVVEVWNESAGPAAGTKLA